MFSSSREPVPSHKLKGNHTFTTHAATISVNEVKEDASAKLERDRETGPLVDKETKASGRVEGTDQPMEYIVHFAKVVKLYLQKNRSCFGCEIAPRKLANVH